MTLANIALHIMLNPVLNRPAVLAAAISFGNEFHKLIVCCVKNYFLLLVFYFFCLNKNDFVILSLPPLFLFSSPIDIQPGAGAEGRNLYYWCKLCQ